MFKVSKAMIGVFAVLIVMGFLYVAESLTNPVLFGLTALMVLFIFLFRSEQTVIGLKEHRKIVLKEARRMHNDLEIVGGGDIKLIPESELKRFVGVNDKTVEILPYKYSSIVEFSGVGNPTRYFLFETSKYGNLTCVSEMYKDLTIKEVSPEVERFEKPMQVSSEIEQKPDGDDVED